MKRVPGIHLISCTCERERELFLSTSWQHKAKLPENVAQAVGPQRWTTDIFCMHRLTKDATPANGCCRMKADILLTPWNSWGDSSRT